MLFLLFYNKFKFFKQILDIKYKYMNKIDIKIIDILNLID